MEIICRIHDTKLVLGKKIQRIGRIVKNRIGTRTSAILEDTSDIIKLDIEAINSDDDTNGDFKRLVDEKTHSFLVRKQVREITDDPVLCFARANSDYVPSPYDQDALAFKSGQLIKVLEKHESGTWFGECAGKRGRFKFNFVTVLNEYSSYNSSSSLDAVCSRLQQIPVSELLSSLDLDQLIPRLSLNGYDSVLCLTKLTQENIQMLDIDDQIQEEKLFTCIAVLKFLMGDEVSSVSQLVSATKKTSSLTSRNDVKDVAPTMTTKVNKPSNVLQKANKDYKTFFATTLAKFEENPKPRIIPICGITPRNVF